MFKTIGAVHCAAAILLAMLLSAWAMQPPEPKAVDAPLGEFSAERAIEELRQLTPDNLPHPVGSVENAKVRDRLLAAFERLGISARTETEISCQSSERFPSFSGCAETTNVIAEVSAGTDPAAKPITLISHYDSVDAGPGAADAGHGVASILEIARIVKAEGPFKNPVMALITDGEEYGLYGANAYFSDPEKAAATGIVINLEARGSNGPSTLFEASDDNAWLIDLFAENAPRPLTNSLLLSAYKTLPNDTDMSESLRAGVPGVNFAFAGTVAHYHTPLDNINILNRGSVQHQGDNALAMVRALANADLNNPPKGEAVYLSLLSSLVLRMPVSFAMPLSILALVGLVYCAVKMPSDGHGGWLRILVAILFVPLTLVLAIGTGFAIPFVLGLSSEPSPGFANPLPLRLTYYLATFAVAAAMAVSLGRWQGGKFTLLSVWFSYALASLALTVYLPGASIVFMVPALVAAILFAVSLMRSTDQIISPAVQFVAGAFAVFILWPLVDTFEMMLGFQLLAVNAVTVMLAVLGLMPLFVVAQEHAKGRWRPAAVCLGGAVVALIVTFVLPSYSERMPMRMNVLHFTDERANPVVLGPVWRAANDYLPDSMRGVADFSDGLEAAIPGVIGADYIAPAPSDDRAQPSVTVVSDDTTEAIRKVRLSFDLPAHARGIRILVPKDQGLKGFQYADSDLSGTYEASNSNRPYQFFTCYIGACRDIDFTLNATSAERKPWLAYMVVTGLPEGGAALQAARPSWAVASQFGDQSIIVRDIAFD